jgi:phosphate transport system permease protein
MSNESPRLDLTRQTEQSPRERLARAFFFACATVSVLTTLGIVVALGSGAMRFFTFTADFGNAVGLIDYGGETVGIWEFLSGTKFSPTAAEPAFGVLPLVAGTLMITVGSAVIALPLGVGTAIYLSEFASKQRRRYLKPALEVLAGIPTVVYGFFAIAYITPALETTFGIELGLFNAASACIVVGIMIIPMVASVSEDAMSAVPDDLRQAGYGMGATKFDVVTGIVIPASISGIASSFILALSRAIGETMAVTLAAGQTPKLLNPLNPASYTESIETMTAAMIHLATGDISALGRAYHSLFGIGITLFAITLVMNLISDYVANRYREEY